MTPFLQQVAEAYTSALAPEAMAAVTFVLPNKRSALFMRHYLGDASPAEVVTIDRLAAQLGARGFKLATRYQQLLILYRCYRALAPQGEEFEHFRFWGDMILSDFGEIDRCLADASMLYRNLRDHREIMANFSEEEARVLNEMMPQWGVTAATSMWRHLPGADDPRGQQLASAQFERLWALLPKLYDTFNDELTRRGLTTAGRTYRRAASWLKEEGGWGSLEGRTMVFAGFSVLTASERSIFTSLQRHGMADFYWDLNFPAMHLGIVPGLARVKDNARQFASRFDLAPREEKRLSYGPIDIVAVPSRTAQARVGLGTLSLAEGGGAAGMRTAVVLPDESLLVPVLNALPSECTDLNVTMGYPMRLTPMASLLRRLVAMQIRMRSPGAGQGGAEEGAAPPSASFFHEDIRALLTHPLIGRIVPVAQRQAVLEALDSRHLFNVGVDELEALAPALRAVVAPVAGASDFASVSRWLDGVLNLLEQAVDADSGPEATGLIGAWRSELAALGEALEGAGVEVEGTALLRLIESAVGSQTLRFSGEPLQGLQVMGMLETRALDFDRLVVLSMNERVFPRRLSASTFIPESLRHAYGLGTVADREASAAYLFYRLLARAGKGVTLVYDSCPPSVGSGDPSQVVTQLLYALHDNAAITHRTVRFLPNTIEPEAPHVDKDERVMTLLGQYFNRSGQGPVKRLSASAINAYINCPLSFYFAYVEGLRADDEVTDYIDSATYGLAMHTVMEHLYPAMAGLPDASRRFTVTPDMARRVLRSSDLTIERLMCRAFNYHYLHLATRAQVDGPEATLSLGFTPGAPRDVLDRPLRGEAKALAAVAISIVKSVVEKELEAGYYPLDFLGAEDDDTRLALELPDGRSVNYRQTIDRVDSINGGSVIRIVDYKTGSDRPDAASLEKLFTDGSPTTPRPKALLQLMLYCRMYARKHNIDTSAQAVRPELYSLRMVGRDGLKRVAIQKQEVDSFMQFDEEFGERLGRVLQEMFDPQVPFVANAGGHACRFCPFTSLCDAADSER